MTAKEGLMKTKIISAILISCTLTLFACAVNEVQKSVDNKLSKEQSISTRQDLRTESQNLILSNSTLTKEQKDQLFALKESVTKRIGEYRDQSLKLQSLLIKEVVGPSYNKDEVKLIKKRIRNVESERVETIFEAVDKANDIIGRTTQGKEQLINDYLIDRHLY